MIKDSQIKLKPEIIFDGYKEYKLIDSNTYIYSFLQDNFERVLTDFNGINSLPQLLHFFITKLFCIILNNSNLICSSIFSSSNTSCTSIFFSFLKTHKFHLNALALFYYQIHKPYRPIRLKIHGRDLRQSPFHQMLLWHLSAHLYFSYRGDS